MLMRPVTDPPWTGRAPASVLAADALADLTRTVAARAAEWRHQLRFPPEARWYGLLHSDPYVQLWLLTWQQDSATELHDHGDSAGAFCVVEGELEELHLEGGPHLRRRAVRAGEVRSFSGGYVHDVANRRTRPAVSVHAYSPPLSSMTFYASGASGLVAVRTEHYDESGSLSPVGG